MTNINLLLFLTLTLCCVAVLSKPCLDCSCSHKVCSDTCECKFEHSGSISSESEPGKNESGTACGEINESGSAELHPHPDPKPVKPVKKPVKPVKKPAEPKSKSKESRNRSHECGFAEHKSKSKESRNHSHEHGSAGHKGKFGKCRNHSHESGPAKPKSKSGESEIGTDGCGCEKP